jgi:hypothetical protein
MQSDLPERHLSRARGDELLGILIPSAAHLMVRKFRINNYELSQREKNTRHVPLKQFIKRKSLMKLKERIHQVGAMGYILLWLLGIPIPVLFIIFLLRGCS